MKSLIQLASQFEQKHSDKCSPLLQFEYCMINKEFSRELQNIGGWTIPEGLDKILQKTCLSPPANAIYLKLHCVLSSVFPLCSLLNFAFTSLAPAMVWVISGGSKAAWPSGCNVKGGSGLLCTGG